MSQETDPVAPISIQASDNVTLTQLTHADVPELYILIDTNRAFLSQNEEETGMKYTSEEELHDSIGKNPDRLRFAIKSPDGKIVGSINLTPDHNRPGQAEIGYYTIPAYEGQGYVGRAIEALTRYGFDTMKYSVIFGKVHENNISSAKTLKRNGYTEIGQDDKYIEYAITEKQFHSTK